MIFSTFNQLNCFLIFIFFGALFGCFANVIFVIFLKEYQKNALKIIFDAIFYSFFAILFIFLINIFNFGKYSFVLLIAIILGFLFIQEVSKNLVVFLQNKWYNLLKKIKLKRKDERKQFKN